MSHILLRAIAHVNTMQVLPFDVSTRKNNYSEYSSAFATDACTRGKCIMSLHVRSPRVSGVPVCVRLFIVYFES